MEHLVALLPSKVGAPFSVNSLRVDLGVPFHQIVLDADAAEAFPGNCFLLPAAGFFMVAG